MASIQALLLMHLIEFQVFKINWKTEERCSSFLYFALPLPKHFSYINSRSINKAHLPLLVKTEDVIANTAGPAALHFMFVSKELLASEASAIVELTVGQHSEQRALPCIHISNHCHSGDEKENMNK